MVFVYETHAKPFQGQFYSANHHVKQIEQDAVKKPLLI